MTERSREENKRLNGLSPEELRKLTPVEVIDYCIADQKAYAETLPAKKKCELLQQLIAIENPDLFPQSRINSRKSLMWVFDMEKMEILVQRREIKSLFTEMHQLPRRVKNRCLRKISVFEQRLKQMEYNYKHGIKEPIPKPSKLKEIAEHLSELDISEAVDAAIKRLDRLKLRGCTPQKLVEVTG